MSSLSGTGLIYQRWFKSLAVVPANSISSNSLVALIGPTVSGLGVSYLPRACLDSLLERRALEVVQATPALPDVRYVALHKGERKSVLISSLIMLAQESCDFSKLFQVEAMPPSESNSRTDLFR
jgi:DNA-binding transcriptional LysR family regulator